MTLDKKLPMGVWISSRFGRSFQRVEYEGITHLCYRCGVVGHTVTSCSNSLDAQVSAPSHAMGPSGGSPLVSDPPQPVHSPHDVDMNHSPSEGLLILGALSRAPLLPPLSSPPPTVPASPTRQALTSSPSKVSKDQDNAAYDPWTLVSRKVRKSREVRPRPPPRPLQPLLNNPSSSSSGLSGPSSVAPWKRVPYSRSPVLPCLVEGAVPGTSISNFASIFGRVAQLNRESPRSAISPKTSIGGDISTLVING